MSAFIQVLYIDSEHEARATNIRLAHWNDAATQRSFEAARKWAVPVQQAKYVFDLHNRAGELVDSVSVDDEGFRAITGKEPLSETEYLRIDFAHRKHMRQQLRAMERGAPL